MKYLVDTCVLSELIKPKPNQQVVQHLKNIEKERLYLSVLTIGELEKGIAKLPESKKKRQLLIWLDKTLSRQFESRVLPLDLECAKRWGRIQGESLAGEEPLPVIDAMIAATALTNNLVVITRNTKDIERCGGLVFNPWSPE